jgi:GNAT superfamily N-acetyltransferase
MHVINEFQNQGIGTVLIKEAESTAVAHHTKTIGIGVDLKPHNSTAQRLYTKLGYIPDGRGPQTSPWGDILFLTKPLPNTANTPHDT